jgi:hypothetical protein
MSEGEAYRVMITAHKRGESVVAAFAKDVAETKATRATEAGRSKGYPCSSLPSRRNEALPPLTKDGVGWCSQAHGVGCGTWRERWSKSKM